MRAHAAKRSTNHEVTELLLRASRGDKEAADRAYVATYEEFRKQAHRIARHPNPGFDPTDLVQSAYTSLVGRAVNPTKEALAGRRHFINYAIKVMLGKLPRGFHPRHDPDVDLLSVPATDPDELRQVALRGLTSVLAKLRNSHPEAEAIFMARYFSGAPRRPTRKELASAFGVSMGTIRNREALALSFLRIELDKGIRATEAQVI